MIFGVAAGFASIRFALSSTIEKRTHHLAIFMWLGYLKEIGKPGGKTHWMLQKSLSDATWLSFYRQANTEQRVPPTLWACSPWSIVRTWTNYCKRDPRYLIVNHSQWSAASMQTRNDTGYMFCEHRVGSTTGSKRDLSTESLRDALIKITEAKVDTQNTDERISPHN